MGNGLRSATALLPSTRPTSSSPPRRMRNSSSSTLPDLTQQGASAMDATRYLPFAGRLLIGLPFAMSGLGKLAAYGPTTELIRAAGLPVAPLALVVAIAVELGGGLPLIAGFRTRLVAAALALFCIATALSFHGNFRSEEHTS